MSSKQIALNNIESTLASAAGLGDTTLNVADPVFPDVTSPDFYHLTLESVSTQAIEIVKVTDVIGTSLIVERGQDGTTPTAFGIGDFVQARTTAGLLDRLGQKSDLGTAYPFQTSVVVGSLSLYVDPAGSDVTGDGSIGAPWATPYKALEELQYIRFGVTGSATVEFAAGTYAMSAQLLVNHPQGDRITLTSNAAAQLVTGMPIGDYSADRNAPVVPPRGATEWYNTAGTVGVSTGSPTRATNRSSDAANNTALLKSQMGCVFEWASAGADESKFLITTRLGGLSNVGLVFPSNTGGDKRHGLHLVPGATLVAKDIQITGGNRSLFINEGQMRCDSIAVSGSGGACVQIENAGVLECQSMYLQGGGDSNLFMAGGGVIDMGGEFITSGSLLFGANIGDHSSLRTESNVVTASGNESIGLVIETNASFIAPNTTVALCSGNGLGGFYLNRLSSSDSAVIQAVGNGGIGILCNDQSSLRSTTSSSQSVNNSGVGVTVDNLGSLTMNGILIDNNGGHGIRVSDGGSFLAASTTLTNNGQRALEAVYAGPCTMASLTVDTSNAASPHMRAAGGSVVQCPAPGSGNVHASTVFDPVHGTASADTSVFSAAT